MTVAELIEHLRALPPTHLVVYRACSDMAEMEAAQVVVTRAVKHHNLPDTFRDYYPAEWSAERVVWVCPKCGMWTAIERKCPLCRSVSLEPRPMEPEFRDVVMFPGN